MLFLIYYHIILLYIVNGIISANRGQPITTKKLHRRSKQSDTRRRRRHNNIVKEDVPAAMGNEDIVDNVIITRQLDIVESIENVVYVDSSSYSVDDMVVTQNGGDDAIELSEDGDGATQGVGGVPLMGDNDNSNKVEECGGASVSEVVACDGTECCSIATDGSGMGYSDVIVGGDTMNVEGVCIIDVKLGLVSRYSYGMTHLCQCIPILISLFFFHYTISSPSSLPEQSLQIGVAKWMMG